MRRSIADFLIDLKKLRENWTILSWNGVMFGIYGDVIGAGGVVGGVGENGQKIPAWLKDVTYIETMTKHVEASIDKMHRIVASWDDEFVGDRNLVNYHDDVYGMFDSIEALKRTTFNTWVLDRGLAKGLIKEVFIPELGWEGKAPNRMVTVGDFGAGGGHYSKFFGETGIIEAIAFDGTPEIDFITQGKVKFMNLAEPQDLNLVFDFVFCIEVAEHIPIEHENQVILNWSRHARKGIIMSWSDSTLGIGHVNPQPFQRTVKRVEELTGMQLDVKLTEKVRSHVEKDYIQNTLGVFIRRNV